MHNVSEGASSFLRYTDLWILISVPEEAGIFFRNVVYLVGWDNVKSPEGSL
jgi:hypothetical protein